jgi:hypothetical protein
VENVTLVGGQTVSAHDSATCAGKVCCVHNPSVHHMSGWRQNWRGDTGVMERICPHGTGHPDPDDVALRLQLYGEADTIHGCDGCCNPSGRITWEQAENEIQGIPI